MTATRDVGDYAAQRLLDLDFSGKQTRELLGERDLSMAEATAIIARGIGKPICKLRASLRPGAAGIGASGHVSEEGRGLHRDVQGDQRKLVALEPRSRENTTPTSFETFVQDVFAPAYHGKPRAA